MARLFWLLPLVFACSDPANPSDGEDLSEHHDGFAALCAAEVKSGAIETFPFAAKTQAINAWLKTELNDSYVQTFYAEKLPQEPLAQQGEILRRQAASAGVSTCALAGLIDFLGQLSTVANAVEDCTRACVERHSADLEDACTTGCGG